MDSLLELFWNLNVSRTVKLMIIFGIIVIIIVFCIYGGRKKSTSLKPLKGKEFYLNDKMYLQYKNSKNPSKCKQKYINCIELNASNVIDQCLPIPCGRKKIK